MKIILSRKGFDSKFGGYPSPILPNGTLISISIPNPNDDYLSGIFVDNKPYEPPTYGTLNLPNSVKASFQQNDVSISTYRDLLTQLTDGFPLKRKKEFLSLENDHICHLDPDLILECFPRENPGEWRAMFGQAKVAQRHLENKGVGPDDLFLFFGRFQYTTFVDNKVQYNGSIPELHIIFGYFQIDKVLQMEDTEQIKPWMKGHPHMDNKTWFRKKEQNTVYIARKSLTWNPKLKGWGCFQVHKDLILTNRDPKVNPKKNITNWNKDFFNRKIKILYHSSSWKEDLTYEGYKAKYFKATDQGQEFVIEENEEFEDKIKKLIEKISI